MTYRLNKLKMNTLVAGMEISYLENTIRVGSTRVKRTSSGAFSLKRTHKDTVSFNYTHAEMFSFSNEYLYF